MIVGGEGKVKRLLAWKVLRFKFRELKNFVFQVSRKRKPIACPSTVKKYNADDGRKKEGVRTEKEEENWK